MTPSRKQSLQRNKIDGPHVCRSVGAMNQIYSRDAVDTV